MKNPAGERIGFVGLGKMGTPMASRLAEAGFDLVVSDIDPSAAEALAARFTRVEVDREDSISGCSIVVLMLPTSRIVTDLLDGESGLFRRLAPNSIVIDMSSSEPWSTVELATHATGREIHLIDAPVTGGVARAVDGSLTIMVGGASGHETRVNPILTALGSRIVPIGPVGAGHAAKALNNLLSATGLLAAAEVLLVASRFGISPDDMLKVLNAGSGSNNATQNKFGQFILSRSFDSGFSASLMAKDLGIAVGLAERTGTPLAIGTAAQELWTLASQTLTAGEDHTAVVTYLEKEAGSRLEHSGAAR